MKREAHRNRQAWTGFAETSEPVATGTTGFAAAVSTFDPMGQMRQG
ncbi:MAG: hypothetical protein GWP58_00575 [Gammaproteobacteria bacterium]|nr:hypothetical protein [Gammaproteobacteria bacterium]